jgi:hypothetical protein
MNINEVQQLISAADVCGHVPLIKGLHGIGKSEGVVNYAKKQNMHYEPLILSLMDTGDMLGLPEAKTVGGMESTIWAAPSWYSNIVNAAWPNKLPIDRLQFFDTGFQKVVLNSIEDQYVEREYLNELYCDYYNVPNDRLQLLRQDSVAYLDAVRSVLFLDELNRAPQDILNASLQLILEHRLHSHILPVVNGRETLIVAAVNPSDGNYSVQEFDPALLDRFIVCDATADFKAWLKWAKASGVNQIVIDFLMDNQTKFHFVPNDGTKGTSPRSWTRLAHYLDCIDETPKDIFTYYLKGTLGTAIAAQFLSFYNNYGNNVSIKTIEKAIELAIKECKDTNVPLNPEHLSESVTNLVSNLEVVRRSEFAATLVKKYINKDSALDALPLLTYLYALPLETLSGVLKNIQAEDVNNYAQLAIFDKELNEKRLFLKLTSYTINKS